MKYSFILIGIMSIFFVFCNERITNQAIVNQNSDSAKDIIQNPTLVQVSIDSDILKLESDNLPEIEEKDTIDCGAIINALFHSSQYKFPADNLLKKEELTAVIEDAKDSVLSVKIILLDSLNNDRMTVDWLTLNCKTKELQTIFKEKLKGGVSNIKYDTRLLDVLMRKCALNY